MIVVGETTGSATLAGTTFPTYVDRHAFVMQQSTVSVDIFTDDDRSSFGVLPPTFHRHVMCRHF
eukprot:8367-Eustigmatos_ZCMA.PRE.1